MLWTAASISPASNSDAVDRRIDLSREQLRLQLFYKKSHPRQLIESAAGMAIGRRPNRTHTKCNLGVRSTAQFHQEFRLAQRQGAPTRPQHEWGFRHRAWANAWRAASTVRWMSSASCAALTNQASNCDGGSNTPWASMAWKKRANRLVSTAGRSS